MAFNSLIYLTKKISFKYLIFALIGGLFMGLSVAPTKLYWLAWIALIPLWITLYRSSLTAILSGFFWGFGYHGFALFWITGIHPMTWMGVSWFNSFIIATFCWIFITLWGAILVTLWAYLLNILIKHNHSLIIIFYGVTIWCVLEKIWSFSPLWWTSLSFTQSPDNLAILQLLKLSGTTTITALIVLINGLFAENIILILESNKDNKFLILGKNRIKSISYKFIIYGVIIFTLTHSIGYLIYQQKIVDRPENVIKIGIIQGNIPNEIKLYDPGLNTALINYTKGYIDLAEKEVDIILTPETALPFFYDQIAENSVFSQAIQQYKIPLFLGAFDRIDNNRYTNSLFVLNSEGKVISKYDKIKLVPLGEYIPFRAIFGSIIRRLSPLDTELIAGKKEQFLKTPFGQAIVGICYDSAFAEIFRYQALKGGQFIISASNNAHYDDTMPKQHHAQDVMRSIETDRWMARATNTGYSAIIDPHGNTEWISDINKYQTHVGEIYRRSTITFYVAKGDWLIIFLTIPLFINLVLKFVIKKSLNISND
ncbi:apolipoprotein N-acyltransferase [Geminocystis sp. NIES-3709]|uniref:apolipoprotein N-acyltransferase n=1 Tax=Geminocystis sp. NIES-3709 TaxID=1617448 RepID=UPI0005FC91F4|nr:apolipoprotein N-acyltransferase [Geminocystis sp. NIES-3709]BAQ64065.1 apolipoprotein N-acyltransferase [Geminocystis sp. NIES-3709]